MFNPWLLLGLLFVALGAIGVVLPLLPTTPFILLAAACFARSSPRMHAWLHRSRLFGPSLRDWEHNHCVRRRARWMAVLMILSVGGSSVAFFVPGTGLKLAGALLLLVGLVVVLRLRVCEEAADGMG